MNIEYVDRREIPEDNSMYGLKNMHVEQYFVYRSRQPIGSLLTFLHGPEHRTQSIQYAGILMPICNSIIIQQWFTHDMQHDP